MKRLLVSLILMSIVSFSFSQHIDSLQWTPEYCMKFRNISGVDISPDGKYVAYVVRDAVMEEEKSEKNGT